MNFCSHCGSPVTQRIPPGDSLSRYVCDACGMIHYENPKVIVGCVAEWQGRILLCKRAIEPRYGLWTVPAGFLENGETTAAGAQRETLEEANARVEIDDLFALYNLPHINQIYMLFRGRLRDADFFPGAETLETRLMDETEVPWSQLAFATVRNTLIHYFNDRRNAKFEFHMGTIEPMSRTTPTNPTNVHE
ncbi:MAG TPA: NUDIX hydrolase [Burkholderiales bacterium]|nr:NUDIX hydrolase [Burkholderiales bacterium]